MRLDGLKPCRFLDRQVALLDLGGSEIPSSVLFALRKYNIAPTVKSLQSSRRERLICRLTTFAQDSLSFCLFPT